VLLFELKNVVGQVSTANFFSSNARFENGHGQFDAERIYPEIGQGFQKITFLNLDTAELEITLMAEDFRKTNWTTSIKRTESGYSVDTKLDEDGN